MEFKDRLKNFRKSAGFKEAKDFAKKINIAYSTYIQYEQGTEPKLTNLIKMANCLGLTLDELTGRKVNKIQAYIDIAEKCGFHAENENEYISLVPLNALCSVKIESSKFVDTIERNIIDNKKIIIENTLNHLYHDAVMEDFEKTMKLVNNNTKKAKATTKKPKPKK